MRKFRVIPISLGLKNNKIAKSNDIVSESQLSSPAIDLIKGGFLEEVVYELKADAEDEKPKIENIEVDSTEVKKEVKPKK